MIAVTVEDYRPLVMSCTRRLPVDPQTIEDIAQEAMVKIHLHLVKARSEQYSCREELDKFIHTMTKNLVVDELRKRRSSRRLITQYDDFGFISRGTHSGLLASNDQFNEFSLRHSIDELLKILPEYEASILRMLLHPSEEFKAFWIRRQKVREFLAYSYGYRYPTTDVLDLNDSALPDFLMITPRRYRRSIARIQEVAKMLLSRHEIRFWKEKFSVSAISNLREKEKPMINLAATHKEQQDVPGCFGVLYDPLVPECKKVCPSRFVCKTRVTETIQKIGQDEFQKEFVRICGVNAADTSPLVLQLQEFFTEIGMEVINNVQNVSAKLRSKTVFLISRKKSHEIKHLVKFVGYDSRAHAEVDPVVSTHMRLAGDGKTWSCSAPDLLTLKNVIRKYLAWYREKI